MDGLHNWNRNSTIVNIYSKLKINMKVIVAVFAALLLICFVAVLLAWPTQLFWNDLMPGLFGFQRLSFWQALELNLLCGILFKNSNTSSRKD